MEFLLSSSVNQNVGTTVKPCSHRPANQNVGTTVKPCSHRPANQNIGTTVNPYSHRPANQNIGTTVNPYSHRPANQNVGTTVKPCSHRPDEGNEQLTDSQGFKILRIQYKKKRCSTILMTLVFGKVQLNKISKIFSSKRDSNFLKLFGQLNNHY